MFIFVLFVVLTTVSLGAFIALKWRYSYWKRKNVPHLQPTLFFGNYKDYILLKKNLGETTAAICQKFPNEPYIGAYFGTEPTIIVQDPDLIKLITTKDFYYFNGREVCGYVDREPTTRNLFFNCGDTWKVMRHNMTQLFTPVRMKNMYPLVKKCAQDFDNMLAQECKISQNVDIIGVMSRFTMDCIGSAAFGVDTETMKGNFEKNPFKVIGDLFFEISYARQYALIVRAIWPAIFYGLGFSLYPKKLTNFFFKLMTNVFTQRGYKPSARNDFVDLILNFKNNEYVSCDNWRNLQTTEKIQLKVDDMLMVSQCQVMFAAGYETSSTTISFALYEIAKNEDAQKKALEEVDRFVAKYGKDKVLEYENLNEFPYAEACIKEVMRLYHVLGTVTREVMDEYTLPSGLRLPRGLRVHLPVHALHRNPRYFPDPDQFRPERFLPENKHNIKPYTYMPFGEGPRICIGLRFGEMVTLTGLVTFLRSYRVELSDDMPRNVQLDSLAMVTRPAGGIRLKVIPRH